MRTAPIWLPRSARPAACEGQQPQAGADRGVPAAGYEAEAMSEKPKNHADVYGKRRPDGTTVLERRKFFRGDCEACGAKTRDLRPYGAAGEWICYSCARKDVATTEKRMGQVLFGEGLDS